MRYLSWIITVPLLVIAVIFAVNHRGVVALDLWPLALQFELPLYLAILVSVFAGFLAGGFVVWVAQGRHRARARQRRYRVEELERELAFLKRKLDKAEADRTGGAGVRALPGRRTGT